MSTVASRRSRRSVTDRHLGGYVRGGDPPAMYPDLWQWLIDGPERVSSVLDVGCGDGSAIDVFRELGAGVYGIDGLSVGRDDIIIHDFTDGPLLAAPVDLVWSCEFVEHVEEQHLSNILPTLCAGRLLAMTHALPDQRGWHHVNCQPAGYWIGAITAHGTHRLDDDLTGRARELAAFNVDPDNYFAKTGLIFRRVEG